MTDDTSAKANCYKVLFRDRTSAFVTKPLQCIYPVGHCVIAPIGGLLAFRSLEAVKHFPRLFRSKRHIVVPAFGERQLRLPPFCLDLGFLESINDSEKVIITVKSIWGISMQRGSFIPGVADGLFRWPSETVAYERITCIE